MDFVIQILALSRWPATILAICWMLTSTLRYWITRRSSPTDGHASASGCEPHPAPQARTPGAPNPAAPPPALDDANAAKILLSGLLPRQRIHWSQEIVSTDRITFATMVGVWTLFLNNNALDWSLRVAMASGFSAVLLGFWRWYTRSLDDAIASLYPSIMHYEKALGVAPEHSALLDLRRKHSDSEERVRQLVREKTVGTRGHLVFDWAAVTLILAMASGTIHAGASVPIRWGRWYDPLHPYALLLLNFAGLFFVFWGMNAYQTNGRTLERLRRGVRQAVDKWKLKRERNTA